MFASLVPTELSHKLIAINAAAIYWALQKRKLPIFSSWSGSSAALLHGIVLAKLAQMYRTNITSKLAFRDAMERMSGIPSEKLQLIGEMTWRRWLSVFLPLPQPMALALSFPDVSKVRTLTYAHVGKMKTTKLLMDVYKHKETKPNAPILLYIHGGGWVIGNRQLPPFSLVYQVASLGWIVCSIDYRLSPMVAFPSHLIDAKRAVAYLRLNAKTQLDADPNFIVAAGESAGGHLASLVALTAGDKSLQPGFESVDTSVRACVDSYGVHDFTDRNGIYQHRDNTDGFVRYIEFLVLQKRMRENKDDFEAASPISWLDASRTNQREDIVPPFLVTHGTWDTLVPFKDSQLFYENLQRYRERTNQRTIAGVKDTFLQVDEAHHMFNYLVSPRTLAHGDAVCAFLDNVHRETSHLPLEARFMEKKVEGETPVVVSSLTVSKL